MPRASTRKQLPSEEFPTEYEIFYKFVPDDSLATLPLGLPGPVSTVLNGHAASQATEEILSDEHGTVDEADSSGTHLQIEGDVEGYSGTIQTDANGSAPTGAITAQPSYSSVNGPTTPRRLTRRLQLSSITGIDPDYHMPPTTEVDQLAQVIPRGQYFRTVAPDSDVKAWKPWLYKEAQTAASRMASQFAPARTAVLDVYRETKEAGDGWTVHVATDIIPINAMRVRKQENLRIELPDVISDPPTPPW